MHVHPETGPVSDLFPGMRAGAFPELAPVTGKGPAVICPCSGESLVTGQWPSSRLCRQLLNSGLLRAATLQLPRQTFRPLKTPFIKFYALAAGQRAGSGPTPAARRRAGASVSSSSAARRPAGADLLRGDFRAPTGKVQASCPVGAAMPSAYSAPLACPPSMPPITRIGYADQASLRATDQYCRPELSAAPRRPHLSFGHAFFCRLRRPRPCK